MRKTLEQLIVLLCFFLLAEAVLTAAPQTSSEWDAESPTWKARVFSAQYVLTYDGGHESEHLKILLELVPKSEGEDERKTIGQFLDAIGSKHSVTLNGRPLTFSKAAVSFEVAEKKHFLVLWFFDASHAHAHSPLKSEEYVLKTLDLPEIKFHLTSQAIGREQ